MEEDEIKAERERRRKEREKEAALEEQKEKEERERRAKERELRRAASGIVLSPRSQASKAAEQVYFHFELQFFFHFFL